jgi:hypothetical protein
MNEFVFEVKYKTLTETKTDKIIAHETKKVLYNMDGKLSCSAWLREPLVGKTQDAPQLSNAISCKQEGRGKVHPNSIGYMQNNGNSPYYNAQFVSLFSGNFSGANGCSVTENNFDRAVATFVARKSVKADWINCKDEYMAPDCANEHFQQWNNDAVIYSLFHTSSNQSSLRNVKYKSKTWNIENQWFWMSVNNIKELANHPKEGNSAVWQDIKQSGEERFVYNKLQKIELSKDAKEVLDLATKLTKESFKYRTEFHSAHPEYQVNTWDAGWYQIKAMLKEYMPEELKKFNELFKKFEDRMRKGVYKFGFLKK